MTPLDELLTVLDREHAESVIEHRIAKRARLTSKAAQLLAKQFARCKDPNAAAEEMLLRGWAGFKPEWVRDQPMLAAPQPNSLSAQFQRRREAHDRRATEPSATTVVYLSAAKRP